MKKISHAIVMVEDIHSSLPRSEFSETDLNEAAQLILKMEGIITPPILLQTGIDSYTIVDGTFEYYAALRAEEIEPLKGETINAYVIESEEEKAVYEKQIKLFRHRSTTPEQTRPLPPEPEPEAVQDEHPIIIEKPFIKQIDRFSTLEPEPEPEPAEVIPSEIVQDDRLIAIEKTLNQLLAKNDALVSKQKVRDLMLHDAVETIKHVGEKVDHFDAEIKQELGEQIKVFGNQMKGLFNDFLTKRSPEEPASSTGTPPISTTSMEEKFLKELNELPAPELALKLERALERVSIRKNKEKVISRIENERKKWPFASVDDLKKRVKGTGFGEQKIRSMLNQWY